MITALKLALNSAQWSILFFIKLSFLLLKEITCYTPFFLYPPPCTLSADDISSHFLETVQANLETLWSSLYQIKFLMHLHLFLFLSSYFQEGDGSPLITAYLCFLYSFSHSLRILFLQLPTLSQNVLLTTPHRYLLSVLIHGKTSKIVSAINVPTSYRIHFQPFTIWYLILRLFRLLLMKTASRTVKFNGPCLVLMFLNLTVWFNSVEPFSSSWSIFLFYLKWSYGFLISLKILFFSTQAGTCF